MFRNAVCRINDVTKLDNSLNITHLKEEIQCSNNGETSVK